METITTKEIRTEERTHHFKCDLCQIDLGQSTEYEDGYYEEYGEYHRAFCLDGHWFNLNMCLCETCANKKDKQIVDALLNLGFKDEENR